MKLVKFWKAPKTKLAGCLWSLQAKIVMKTTKKAVIFQIKIPREILSRKRGRKMVACSEESDQVGEKQWYAIFR